MSRALYEPSALAAAKVIAEQRGHEGRLGGWIYRSDAHDARTICHGWLSYTRRLERRGAIVAIPVTYRGKDITRFAINWRKVPR